MKVYMSVDMEGATGVTGMMDTAPGQPAHERFRRLLTQDVNAAIEGAIKGGATEIIVNEAHSLCRNLLIEELNPKAELISGFTKPLIMVNEINSTFDAAFMIGYHARAGTRGAVINHTLFLDLHNVRVNDQVLGEFGLSSMVAGHFNVPVALVTGDDKTIKEAVELVGNIETVVVKKGIDYAVAQCLPPEVTTMQIRKAAENALTHVTEFKPFRVQTPLRIEIDFAMTTMAEAASLITGIEIENQNPRTVSFTSEDAQEGYRMITAAIFAASYAKNIATLRSTP